MWSQASAVVLRLWSLELKRLLAGDPDWRRLPDGVSGSSCGLWLSAARLWFSLWLGGAPFYSWGEGWLPRPCDVIFLCLLLVGGAVRWRPLSCLVTLLLCACNFWPSNRLRVECFIILVIAGIKQSPKGLWFSSFNFDSSISFYSNFCFLPFRLPATPLVTSLLLRPLTSSWFGGSVEQRLPSAVGTSWTTFVPDNCLLSLADSVAVRRTVVLPWLRETQCATCLKGKGPPLTWGLKLR